VVPPILKGFRYLGPISSLNPLVFTEYVGKSISKLQMDTDLKQTRVLI
jgi:hypothetical protein